MSRPDKIRTRRAKRQNVPGYAPILTITYWGFKR